MSEAKSAWHIGAKETIIWAYWKNKVMIRKSGRIWTVRVADMVKHFGWPKEPIELNP